MKINFTLIFSIISFSMLFAQDNFRLDSIRIKAVINPTADTSYRGSDNIYEDGKLKRLNNIVYTNGVKNITTYRIYDVEISAYKSCQQFFNSSGTLQSFSCTYDTIVNNKAGVCFVFFEQMGQTTVKTSFQINFKRKDNKENLLADSTLIFDPVSKTLTETNVHCYTYDEKNNPIELIRKIITGTTTFYGDKTDYKIVYNNQGKKESEVITWTYLLVKRSVDSIFYSYENDLITEQKYFLFSAGGSPTIEKSISLKDKKGILNIKQFKKSASVIGLYLSSNADYYYSGNPTSTNDIPLQSIQIYPNPASDILNIDTSISLYDIKDVNGRSVAKGYNVDGQIDIQDLTPGIYFIEATGSTKKFKTSRFIKY